MTSCTPTFSNPYSGPHLLHESWRLLCYRPGPKRKGPRGPTPRPSKSVTSRCSPPVGTCVLLSRGQSAGPGSAASRALCGYNGTCPVCRPGPIAARLTDPVHPTSCSLYGVGPPPDPMTPEAEKPATRLLRAAVEGDPRAAQDLLPLVYDELRTLARSPPEEGAPRSRRSNRPPWCTRLICGWWAARTRAGMGGDISSAAGRPGDARYPGRIRSPQVRQEARWAIAAASPSDQVEPTFEPPLRGRALAVDEAVRRLEQDDPRKGQIVNPQVLRPAHHCGDRSGFRRVGGHRRT